MTDQELKDKLLECGFDVPMIVIRSWAEKSGFVRKSSMREFVRNQLSPYVPAYRKEQPVPQVLKMFDVRIHRRKENSRPTLVVNNSECNKVNSGGAL